MGYTTQRKSMAPGSDMRDIATVLEIGVDE